MTSISSFSSAGLQPGLTLSVKECGDACTGQPCISQAAVKDPRCSCCEASGRQSRQCCTSACGTIPLRQRQVAPYCSLASATVNLPTHSSAACTPGSMTPGRRACEGLGLDQPGECDPEAPGVGACLPNTAVWSLCTDQPYDAAFLCLFWRAWWSSGLPAFSIDEPWPLSCI